MAFKDILLHIDDSPSCPARLEMAVNFARAHGANLRAIYVLSHSYYAPRQDSGASEAEQKARALFTEKVAQAGISAEWLFVDWSVVGVETAEIISHHACYADIIIVGQPDGSSQSPHDLPERLGLASGRPLLVVPYVGSFSQSGHRVMIAWKAGRESGRAVHDALPVLKKASYVQTVTIGPVDNHDHGEKENATKICSHLGWHGISAHQEHIPSSGSLAVGDLLLNHACEQKMDLLVMGAYAHSRRGFTLSPVAKHLMKYMTLPILFSH